jgi:hypothetical protein
LKTQYFSEKRNRNRKGGYMKKNISQKFPVSVLLVSLSLVAGGSLAAVKPESNSEAEKKVELRTQTQSAEKRQKILEEATQAVQETQRTLKFLDEDKKKEALSALERATGKLELILARDPSLALAPSNVTVMAQKVLADVDTIHKLRKQAQDFLADGRLQDARHIINNLGSETIIRVTNVPLATYPAAIKKAAKFVDDNKFDEAKRTLGVALNTLVITDTIIPIPVATAEALLVEANTLSQKGDRTADENKRVEELLKKARSQLKLAQEFGYGTKQDYKNMYTQLDEIDRKVVGGKSGSDFFTKINTAISDLLKKSSAG